MNPYYDPDNIQFTGKLRSFVLRHVLKHEDLTEYIETLSSLKRIKGHQYTCACPWCGKQKGFILNKKTGDCVCSACEKQGDLVDLLYESLGQNMNFIIGMFIAILERGGRDMTKPQKIVIGKRKGGINASSRTDSCREA